MFVCFSGHATASDMTSCINSLGVDIRMGNMVVIGRDTHDYDIAMVDSIITTLVVDDTQETESINIAITYYHIDKNRDLVPKKRFRKPWKDICPENAVIMSLGKIQSLDESSEGNILEKTKDIYDY